MAAPPDGASLLVVGHAVVDHVFSVPELPRAAEKYRATALEIVGGGMAANAAVAAARLGGRVAFAGTLGADEAGDRILADLAAEGIDVSRVRRLAGVASPFTCVAVDPAGERQVVNFSDPRLFEGVEGLAPTLPDGCRAVLADYRWPAAAVHYLGLAKDSGRVAVLDYDRNARRDPVMLASATHVVFGAAGLASLAGTRDPVAGLAAARKWTDAWLAVTLGGEGVVWLEGERAMRLPAHRVTAVDTLAAGDVFHGAFTLALAEGRDALDAMRFATAAAGVKVTRRGGRIGAPNREETLALAASAPPLAPETARRRALLARLFG